MKTLNVAYYVTPHGLGHATRALEVIRVLMRRGHAVVLSSGATVGLFFQSQLANEEKLRFTFRTAVFDSGALQPHAFTVDMQASLKEYYQRADGDHREGRIKSEESWLLSNSVDVVVSDVTPLPCQAACRVGVPCVCVSNFSWDFVFAEYLSQSGTDAKLRRMLKHIAEDYACADAILRLPGYTPMPAFQKIVDVPMVVRPVRTPAGEVKKLLGIPGDHKMVLFVFGAHALTLEPSSYWLPDKWMCVACTGGKPLTASGSLPPNFKIAAADAFVPDLVAASDAVMGKVGYGSVSECLAAERPLVFVRRDHFNEEPFLRQLMQKYQGALEISKADLMSGNWAPYLEEACDMKVTYGEPLNGADVVADHIIQISGRTAAAGWNPEMHASLRTFVVDGYEMHGVDRAASQALKRDLTVKARADSDPKDVGAVEPPPESVEVLYPQEMPLHSPFGAQAHPLSQADTVAFIGRMQKLSQTDEQAATQSLKLSPDQAAAASLFLWKDPLVITRAPGRCDVLGGFADYSGAMVLQIPLDAACHVALQMQPVSQHRLWRHMQAALRLSSPVIRVVSMTADKNNRSPSFNIQIKELMDGNNPKPYDEIQRMLQADVSRQWAAYVVGCILVLMHEKNVRFRDSIAILVDSEIPEGKGFASSAALEVAVMQALNAALKLGLDGLAIAKLCHKVENSVVGFAGGLTDHIVSSVGRENELLGIDCSSNEIEARIPLPKGLRFWAVDSGSFHGTEGEQYSTIRAAAFMGLRYLEEASDFLSRTEPHKRLEFHSLPAMPTYDCTAEVTPSEWYSGIENLVPETVQGSEFLSKFGKHYDKATEVLPGFTYKVRKATEHPIMECHRVHVALQLLDSLQLQTSFESPRTMSRGASFLNLAAEGSNQTENTRILALVGELLLQSHSGYSSCGVGSVGTDALVRLARECMQADNNEGLRRVFGARITGGGCGGCVCIATVSGEEGEFAVQSIADKYTAETHHKPTMIGGSSTGAIWFDHALIRVKPS